MNNNKNDTIAGLKKMCISQIWTIWAWSLIRDSNEHYKPLEGICIRKSIGIIDR